MTATRLGQVRANVTDIRRSVDWYTTVLGFEVDILYPEDEPTYAQFRSTDGAAFSIGLGGAVGGRYNFNVDSADKTWAEFSGRAELDVVEELFTAPWGTRKFTIRDPDGNELGFVVGAAGPAPTFGLIGLVSSDMATSLAFYRRLGLGIPESSDSEPHVEVSLPGGLRLAWDTVDVIRSFDPDWTPPVGGHRVALAFDCRTAADVDRIYTELVAAGHHGKHEPWNAFWGQRYATVHDPDGTTVELYAGLDG